MACAVLAACGKVVDVAPDAAPTCTDNIKNGTESDVDCGGSCPGCADGKVCTAGPDCENGICTGGSCAAPSCDDNVKNGTELDVDCAGPCGARSCKVGQVCDDNTQCETQMCAGTNVCIAARRVFVTRMHYTGGQIGGLTGADAKCQAEANAAQLGGTYKAWLSDLTGSPASRFTKSTIAPYVRTGDGFVLAENFDDLVDGAINGSINRDAMGMPATGGIVCATGAHDVWTNTNANGAMAADSLSCSNWTANTGGSAWGRLDIQSQWTSWCSGGNDFCAKTAPFYCFEQ